MQHVTDNLKLHEKIQKRASVIFASYRDLLEQMHEAKAVVAACMLIALEDSEHDARDARRRQHGAGSGSGSGPGGAPGNGKKVEPKWATFRKRRMEKAAEKATAMAAAAQEAKRQKRAKKEDGAK